MARPQPPAVQSFALLRFQVLEYWLELMVWSVDIREILVEPHLLENLLRY